MSSTGDLSVFGRDAETVRAEARDKRAELARQQLELNRKVDSQRAELEAARRKMELEFEKRLGELQAKLGPLQAELKKLQEVMWTVDLYLGRDEQIELLRDGAPAPVDEPITVRQMVLAMDQESIIYLDQGGLDGRAHNVDAFFEWMLASQEHVEQVIPEPKCVVVLVPTHQKRNYGDPFLQKQMDELNRASYWMIRNGEKLYRMSTDIVVGDRLVPQRSEFLDFFYERAYGRTGDRVQLQPGSDQWMKAQDAADARQRHYMRLMLILQGLVDRTVVFHPLPAVPPNFMSLQAQDEGKVRIINELDNVLDSGRPPFREWQQTLNSKLRVGMRIIGDFGHGFRDTNHFDGRTSYGKHSRLWPEHASFPQSLVPHLIEDKKGPDEFVIRYERTDTVWRGYQSGKAKVRASCKIYPGDRFILPFDLVTVQEMEAYLSARTERHDYLDMVPVLRAAIEVKRAENKAEEPFRELLVGAILAEHDDDVTEIRTALPELITNWKIANRWARPLVSESREQEGNAVAAIVREYGLRKKADTGNAQRDRDAVQRAQEQVPELLAVGRRRDGRYVAYAPSQAFQRVWLDEYTWTKTGKAQETKRWQIPMGRTLSTITWLHTTDAWKTWKLRESRSDHISGPEAEVFCEEHLFPAVNGPAIAITHKHREADDATGWFHLYAWRSPERGDIEEEDSQLYPHGTDGRYIEVFTARWKRDVSGNVVPVPVQGSYNYRTLQWDPDYIVMHREYAHFSYSPRRGDFDYEHAMPGIPISELDSYRKRYGSGWRNSVMVWLDDVEWQHVLDTTARDDASSKEGRNDTADLRDLAVAYCEQVSAKGQAIRTAALKKRFVEDYGTENEELWQHHLSTLKNTEVHVTAGWAMVAAMKAGIDPVGKTIAEATEGFENRSSAAVIIPPECADIRIEPVELASDDEDEEDEVQED